VVYALIAVLMAGFGGGFWISHELDKAELWEMRSEIKRQKTEGEAVLKDVIKKVEQQKKEQEKANENLEKSRQSSIETINAYHDQLAHAKLRVTVTGQSRCSALPEARDPGELPSAAADSAELSAESTEYLRNLALKADTCAINHNAMLAFVKSGCGFNDRAN
jgi:hypothetical protein